MKTLTDYAKQIVIALNEAVLEHGTPNSFGFRELEEYGGPPAMLAGRAAKAHTDLLREAGYLIIKGRVFTP